MQGDAGHFVPGQFVPDESWVAAVSLWNGFLRLTVIGLCANAVTVRADDSDLVTAAPLPASTEATDALPDPLAGYSDKEFVPGGAKDPVVLVLLKGRVIRGHIRARGDGYDINQPSGRMFVGSSQIWVMAKDLTEAHRKIKDSIQLITPDVNIWLAKWCSRQQMWGTARQELLDALHQDPHREEARRMLAQVELAQKNAASPTGHHKSTAVDDALRTGVAMPRRALGGLPRSLAQNFTRQIQPLLVNACASCHKANSEHAFALVSTKGGSTPAIAEQNLAAVLNQLTTTDISRSPLMQKAFTAHGGMKAAPLHGRMAESHRQKLMTWSALAITHVGRRSSGHQAQITARTKRLRQQPAAATLQSVGFESAGNSIEDMNPHGVSRDRDRQKPQLLADAAKRNRRDPFNPETFNQRYRHQTPSVRSFGRR